MRSKKDKSIIWPTPVAATVRLRKVTLALVAGLMAVLVGFGGVGVANAGGIYETQIPDQQGSFERGYWRGSWKVSPTESWVRLYSINKQEYCEAHQDYNPEPAWKRMSPRQECYVRQTGNPIVAHDYVTYGVEDK